MMPPTFDPATILFDVCVIGLILIYTYWEKL